VTVPLPCLQKKRRVSAKGRIKQLQKQKVYEHIYHEVYSAQDTHAIAAEKNKASNADSQDAEEKENPIGDVSCFCFLVNICNVYSFIVFALTFFITLRLKRTKRRTPYLLKPKRLAEV